MKFHKRVPSFSFTSFSFNTNTNTNEQQQSPTPPQFHSQPSSPSRTHFEVQPAPHSAALPSHADPSFGQQQPPPTEQQLVHRPRDGSITLLLSPDDPLRFIVQNPHPTRKRSGSLIEQSMSSPPPDHPDDPAGGRRRSSFAESLNQGLSTLAHVDRGRISSPNRLSTLTQSNTNTASTSNTHFTRHRKRLSNLFSPLSYYTNSSRSPSPATRNGRLRLTNSLDPAESDRESNPDPATSLSPQIDLPSSSEDDSDSNHSNSDRSSDLEPEFSDSEAQTILANTNANASSVTPIDYLQKSNQPIPFIDQAPNITSPPPLPISFAPTDPRSLSKPVIPTQRLSITSRNGSIRRRTSTLGPRKDLKLTVSRPIYQKNRCTITIEHGNWLEAAKKAERTRFYLVACDLSDESKYAIEWTIGTVLRQGDECLVIMIIETDSKFDPDDGPGTAADRTAKIRNQKDRQEKAALLVREVTALLERTGLHTKVTCQAIHGKNPKRMLIDCIDFLEPNLVIVGRRGETSSKGSLMGSVSHYLVQKSSVPVMVARRRLRTLPKVYKKRSGVVPTAQQQRKLNEAAMEKSMAVLTEQPLDHKRLSIVSEEADINKLNFHSLQIAAEKPQLEPGTAEDLHGDEKDHQKTDQKEQAKEHKEHQNQAVPQEENHDKEDLLNDEQDREDYFAGKQKQLTPESLPQANQVWQEEPVLTSQPVSILEPVV